MNKRIKLSYKELKRIIKEENVPMRTKLKTKEQMYNTLMYEYHYFDREIGPNLLDSFPTTMLHDITKYFNFTDLVRFYCANKLLLRTLNCESVWKSMFEKDFKHRLYERGDMTWYELYKDFIQYPYELTQFMHARCMNVYTRGTNIRKELLFDTDMVIQIKNTTKMRSYKNKPINFHSVVVFANDKPIKLIFQTSIAATRYTKTLFETSHFPMANVVFQHYKPWAYIDGKDTDQLIERKINALAYKTIKY